MSELFVNQVDEDQDSQQLIVKKNGKVGEGNQNFTFTDLLHPQTIKLVASKGDKKHLIIHDGLNLCGKCLNQSCPAFQSKSWVGVGYGTFDIGRKIHKNKCQTCQQFIDGATIKTLGYSKAKVHFQGMKQINNKSQLFQSTVYEKEGKLIKFSGMDEHMCLWSYLDVTVSTIEKQ